MRLIIILWITPLVFFWGWYGLSAYDINMGSFFLSRPFHDHMFRLYGNILGVPPQEVPALIAATFAFDSMLLFTLAAFRWRKSWFPQAKLWVLERFNKTSDNHPVAGNKSSDIEQYSMVAPVAFSSMALRSIERSTYPVHPAE